MRPPLIILLFTLLVVGCAEPQVQPESPITVEFWQAEWPFADGTYDQRWKIQLQEFQARDSVYYNGKLIELPWCPDDINAHVFERIDSYATAHHFTIRGITVEGNIPH